MEIKKSMDHPNYGKRQISLAFDWSSSLLDTCLINFTVEMGSLAVLISLVFLIFLVLSPTTLLSMTESLDFLKTAAHNKVSSLTFFRPKLKYVLKGVVFIYIHVKWYSLPIFNTIASAIFFICNYPFA